MHRIVFALALLFLSSEAYSQEKHAVGSRCTPVLQHDNEPLEFTSCSTIYMPKGSWPKKEFYEHLPWKVSRDRLVPLRPITAEAAQK